ncbi:MAG: UdgX family uracil-DNA binding protein, partial [Gemmatimonadaceae bacterium]|nr:UdgX family uracil-DNA binding protein [Gemmatimonadaceae bacterium]
LWAVGTRTVFGEGPAHAEVMFVGEQPGDQEDRIGRPFVGPAGRLLDDALAAAGIDRSTVYVTNAVKHFKWERDERSGRRIHKKPADREVRACRPWLEQEIALVHPRVIVCLGATAAQSLLGKAFRVTQHRGEPIAPEWAEEVFATVHPSAVLRAPPDAHERARAAFFADIAVVARYLREHPGTPRPRRASPRSAAPRPPRARRAAGDASLTRKRTFPPGQRTGRAPRRRGGARARGEKSSGE